MAAPLDQCCPKDPQKVQIMFWSLPWVRGDFLLLIVPPKNQAFPLLHDALPMHSVHISTKLQLSKIPSNLLFIFSGMCFLGENFQRCSCDVPWRESSFFSLESSLLFSSVAMYYYGNPLLVALCYPFSMTPVENSFRNVDCACSRSLRCAWTCPSFEKVPALIFLFGELSNFYEKKKK